MRVSKQTDQAWMSTAGAMPALAPGSLENFPHPVAILDAAGGIVAANDGFSAEAGLSSDDGAHAAEALLEALAGQAGQTVSLPGREGQRLVDLLVLPLAEPGWRLVM